MWFRPTPPRTRCSPEFFRFLPLPELPDSCVKLNPAVVMNDCRSVELRALCNEVPRTPPGPEGSNGTGNTSGAADYPKFLALDEATFLLAASLAISWLTITGRRTPNLTACHELSCFLPTTQEQNLELFLCGGTCETLTHELSSDCQKVAAADFCGSGGARTCDGDPGQCHQERSCGPRLHLFRRARRGQNHRGADSG